MASVTTYQRTILATRGAMGVLVARLEDGTWFGSVVDSDGEPVALPSDLPSHETEDEAIDALREWAQAKYPHNDVIVLS